MNLNERLLRIADRIENGETMADIGTDHGFLPIYLLETGISPKVIMTDISEPSLMKGRQNFNGRLSGMEDRADFRVGSGISVLAPEEVSTVVIAGMGGRLICDILSEDMEKTRSFKKFILQPRTKQGELRRWLLENGFAITHEDLVYEGAHIPEIITAVPYRGDAGAAALAAAGDAAGDASATYEGIDKPAVFYDVPPWIKKATGPVEEFIERRLNTEKRKLERVMLSSVRNRELESRICDNIYYLKHLQGEK